MRMRAAFAFYLSDIALQTSLGQTWLDSVRTIYSTTRRLHSTTFMQFVSPYSMWSNTAHVLAVVEDSSAASTIKAASIDDEGNLIQSLTTILARPYPIGKMQYIGVGENLDSLEDQYSQNGSHAIFLNAPWWFSDSRHDLVWRKMANGVGNIVGASYFNYSSPSWSTLSSLTQDSAGMNTPIFLDMAPLIVKPGCSAEINADYLTFVRTMQDSNAFVRMNHSWNVPRFEFWRDSPLIDIDAQSGYYVPSAWIEQTQTGYDLCLHIGLEIIVAVEHNESMPTVFSLEQNFPNPFNPSTTIRYYLPTSGNVKLSVFDILGRELTTLVDEKQSNGYHEVKWNADAFPSGIYFYRLTSERNSLTKKMILIR